jgi:proteasome lid subunit RPN8/RPN11
MKLTISKNAVLSCIAGAQSAYPYEFIALLEGEAQENGDITIDRLVIPPGLRVGHSSASWDSWMLPQTISHLGTFHSHPRGPSRPSGQDLRTGSKEGGVHLILGWPYELANLKAYDSQGKPLKFQIL